MNDVRMKLLAALLALGAGAAAVLVIVFLARDAVAAGLDGDPASDSLITLDAFVPVDGGIPAGDGRQLVRLLEDAKAKGFHVKVALIPKQDDLGAVTILWKQPQRYATFLGQELFYVFKGKLLIVMPNGYGIYEHGRPIAADRKLLDSLPVPKSASDVAAAATVAVQRLALREEIVLTRSAPPAKSFNNRDRLVIALAAVAAVALGVLVVSIRRLRRSKEFG
jgi:hypothetical protein